jgi:hypothetical protein
MSTESMTGGHILPFVPRPGLVFGIFHGGVVQSHYQLATGKPDCPEEVNRALDKLQGDKHLFVRTYLRFTGSEADLSPAEMPAVSELARYTWNGRKLDLVLSNWDSTGNIARWAKFVERAIERYGDYVQNIQICEEPNQYDYPGDGRFAHTVEAVVTGIRTARDTLRRRSLSAIVGFNSVPTFDPNDGFWRDLGQKTDPNLLNAVDYVGLNLYLDVVEPVTGEMEDAVEEALIHFREVTLAQAGIPPTIPMHISENGWPTGPNRFYTRQAEILERIVRKIVALRNRLNITQFGLFSLRDADTANPDAARQFGIMRDDYTPKPAFETYRRLISELGS